MGRYIFIVLCVGFIQTIAYAKSCKGLFDSFDRRLKTYDYRDTHNKIDFLRGHVFENATFEISSHSYVMVIQNSKNNTKKIDKFRFDSENENIYLDIINYIMHFRRLGLEKTLPVKLSGYFSFKTEIKFGKTPSRSVYPVFIIDHFN